VTKDQFDLPTQGANINTPQTRSGNGAYRDRTGDPQLAKLVLSQLS
jgi:hypothetical protein